MHITVQAQLWLFLPRHNFVTSILSSCHSQISMTTQIPWPFPDLSQIPLNFQISKNSRSGNPSDDLNSVRNSVMMLCIVERWTFSDTSFHTSYFYFICNCILFYDYCIPATCTRLRLTAINKEIWWWWEGAWQQLLQTRRHNKLTSASWQACLVCQLCVPDALWGRPSATDWQNETT